MTEAGFVDFNNLRPYLMRLSPSARRRLAALPATRRQLQIDLRRFVKEIGPALGDIYYEKDLNWKTIQEMNRKEHAMSTTPLHSPAREKVEPKKDQ